MKKTKKYRAKSTRDDSPSTGGHIHFLRIHAFVTTNVDFTEEETAHFDACSECRLKVVDALRDVVPQVAPTITQKAA